MRLILIHLGWSIVAATVATLLIAVPAWELYPLITDHVVDDLSAAKNVWGFFAATAISTFCWSYIKSVLGDNTQ